MEENRNTTSLYPLHVSLSFADCYSHYTDSRIAAYCTVDTGSRIGQLQPDRYSTLWSLDLLTLIKLLPSFTPTSQQKVNVPSPVSLPPSRECLASFYLNIQKITSINNSITTDYYVHFLQSWFNKNCILLGMTA